MAIDEDDPEEVEDPTDIDQLDAVDAADLKVQDLADEQAWAATCLSVISARFERVDRSYHVQHALDQACIAACHRLTRIMHSDVATRKICSKTNT